MMATRHEVEVPPAAKRPQDRRAKAKAEAEASVAPDEVVEYGGHEYVIRGDAYAEVETVERIGDMLSAGPGEQVFHIALVLRQILGSAQWRAFKARHPQVPELFAMWSTIDDASGKSASSQTA